MCVNNTFVIDPFESGNIYYTLFVSCNLHLGQIYIIDKNNNITTPYERRRPVSQL